MSGWLLPALAAGFWLGILASPVLAGRLGAVAILVAGAIGICAAAWTAPRPARQDAALARSGLIGPEPRPVAALPSPVVGVARAPPAVPAIVLVVAFALLGAGWEGVRADRLRSSYLARLAPAEATLEGSLSSDPSEDALGWSAEAGVTLVRAGSLERVRESVWLEGRGRPPAAARGDRIEVRGVILPPKGASFGWFLARRGIAVYVKVASLRVTGRPTNPLDRAARAVRGALLSGLERAFPGRDAGLLMGLALGDTSRLDPADEEHFRATGLGHLLAVSGENVAMVLAPVLGLALLLRLGRKARFALGAATVGFFVVLTGGEPSVLRAGVMAVLTLFAVLLGRPRSTAAVLGGTVLSLIALDPTLVWSIGFQLSVAATAGIVALAGPVATRLRRLPRPLALAGATTLSAQAGVAPLLLFHFHQVPLVTLPANLLAFPAVAPAMLLGLAAAALALVAAPLGQALAFLTLVPLRYLEGLADRLATAPLPIVTGGGAVTLGVGLLAVAGVAVFLRSGRGFPRRAAVAVATLLPVLVWSTALRAGPPSGLVVRFFDVGQGDAALVQSPAGASVLIDGGPDPYLVATKLAALGVKRLDAVVATHPHLDHFVGLPAVLARFSVSLVIDSGCHPPESRSPPYLSFLHAIRAEGIPERHPMAGDVLLVGDLRFDVLSPDRCWQGTNSDPNNDSLVLLLSYRGDTVLFANEPEGPAQQAMLDAHEPVTAEVLNVPHHGAGTSIAPFFQTIHETIAVVSVGPNSFGHPVPATLAELRATGARVLRTDRTGDIVIRFGPRGMEITTLGHPIRLPGGP